MENSNRSPRIIAIYQIPKSGSTAPSKSSSPWASDAWLHRGPGSGNWKQAGLHQQCPQKKKYKRVVLGSMRWCGGCDVLKFWSYAAFLVSVSYELLMLKICMYIIVYIYKYMCVLGVGVQVSLLVVGSSATSAGLHFCTCLFQDRPLINWLICCGLLLPAMCMVALPICGHLYITCAGLEDVISTCRTLCVSFVCGSCSLTSLSWSSPPQFSRFLRRGVGGCKRLPLSVYPGFPSGFLLLPLVDGSLHSSKLMQYRDNLTTIKFQLYASGSTRLITPTWTHSELKCSPDLLELIKNERGYDWHDVLLANHDEILQQIRQLPPLRDHTISLSIVRSRRWHCSGLLKVMLHFPHERSLIWETYDESCLNFCSTI